MNRFTYKHGGDWCINGANGKLTSDIHANCYGEAINRLAEYEDMEEQGLLIKLPCKVGDTVWFKTYKKSATICEGIQPHTVDRIDVELITDIKSLVPTKIYSWEIGKKVFLTLEEAEKALEAQHE